MILESQSLWKSEEERDTGHLEDLLLLFGLASRKCTLEYNKLAYYIDILNSVEQKCFEVLGSFNIFFPQT